MVEAERKIKSLKRKLAICLNSVLEIRKFVSSFNTKTHTLSDLNVRKISLISIKDDFHTTFDSYLDVLEEDTISSESLKIINEFNDQYHRSLSAVENLIEGLNKLDQPESSNTTNVNKSSIVKLPELRIQTFDGKYDTWLSFKETFKSVIINRSDISAVVKLEYLKSSVSEEIRGFLDGVPPTEAGFDSAWTQLCDRYDNRRIILETHIKAILNLKPIGKESASEIRHLLDTVTIHTRALKVLNQPVDSWDVLLVYIVMSNLDAESIRHWHNKLEYNEIPTWSKMSEFLQCRARVLESIDSTKNSNNSTNTTRLPTTKPTSVSTKPMKQQSSSRSFLTNNRLCVICNLNNHKIKDCEKYNTFNPKQRFEKVNELKLCRNCLGTHLRKNCESKNVCRICRNSHHTSLHECYQQSNSSYSQTPLERSTFSNANNQSTTHMQSDTNQSSEPSLVAHCSSSSTVLLATALIHVIDSCGRPQLARALLDSGSQRNFVSASFCQLLGIKKQRNFHPVTGVNDTATQSSAKITTSIKSLLSDFTAEVELLCIPKITSNLPAQTLNTKSLSIPQGIELADPTFYKSGKIDILLGSSIFWKVLKSHRIELGDNLPILHDTVLGYVIGGDFSSSPVDNYLTALCFTITNEELNQLIKAFWEIENSYSKPVMSKEHQECEKHFCEIQSRDQSGRYVVQLPIKQSLLQKLGQSKSIATNRFYQLERKLNLQPELKQQYIEFMNEYLSLGHMRKISDDEIDSSFPSCYIPHHCVVKPDSSTTKVRVVFDASCSTSTGFALNDILMVGPTVQQELFDIVLRFRIHPFVFTADIEKMYRQVIVHEKHQQLQLILWRENEQQPLSTFKLLTVTYGTGPAPFMATRVLKQLALDEGNKFPQAVNAMNDFYVDDILTGSNSIDELQETKIQLIKMLRTAGMNLRKFSANHVSLLDDLPSDCLEKIVDFKNSSLNQAIKTLGLVWNPVNDTLNYNSKSFGGPSDDVTKRLVFSRIASIFDPLGLLSPFIICAKIQMQRLWLLQCGWDDVIPQSEAEQFDNFFESVRTLDQFEIQRCVVPSSYETIQIHGFSDSSVLAYGAMVYIRSTTSNNEIQCNVLCSKSRVCPLNKFTLAKMELCAAELLSELVDRVISALKIKFDQVHLWTDSTITLSWIQSQPNLLKTFESHRVAHIQQLTENHQWHHVRSKQNPADLITRGQSLDNLMTNSFWWHGPEFLSQPQDSWMTSSRVVAMTTLQNDTLHWLFEKCSNFKRLITSVGYWFRAIANVKKPKSERQYNQLTFDEFQQAKLCVIRLAQHEAFHDEIKLLKKGKSLRQSSHLLSLNPVLHDDGILRVQGRLSNSVLPDASKYPIILPKDHLLSTLIIRHFHEKNHHQGVQSLIYTVRQEYWPINGKQLAKQILKKCILCFKNKPKGMVQLMGSLPQPRVVPSPPFTVTGLDYCGPFNTKNKNQRKGPIFKSYIAVFICFSTKAIHLDVVSDLTSECFLQALSRFVSHHGKPAEIHCDNGKTFVGANNELKRFQQFLHNQANEIISSQAREGIKFKFIAPYSPSLGGLWESTVKQVKYYLKRIANDQKFTFEELMTICAEIEAILNSRPLTILSDDPNDPLPLTAGHFLIGRPLTAINTPSYIHQKTNLLTRWQFIQQLIQSFWAKWSREYLNTLQQRKKWKNEGRNLQVNDVVLIHDDNNPPTQWLMGVVTAVHPGADKKIRVVTVRTKLGETQRSITKLYKMPIDIE